MARPRRPAQASRATRAAIACATRCARRRKTRRSVKPAPRKRTSVASRRNSVSLPDETTVRRRLAAVRRLRRRRRGAAQSRLAGRRYRVPAGERPAPAHAARPRHHLDSEMSVVRNEFELGENNPGSVLFQRMQQAAYPWHNYGNPIIGMRSDIERVPIDRLQAFYRTWYQPDNAVLIVAGRFDEARAVELVARHFGALPRPSRPLPALYTEEPTQDGERTVILRRSGDNQLVALMYRVPAGAHPDYAAVDVLTNVLGDTPSGRLHRALVQKGLASSVWGSERGMHDPGYG